MTRFGFTSNDIARLEKQSSVIREDIIKMIAEAKSGHPGGSLSSADIITALYFHVMNIDPKNPSWPDRDRFVLSKGHACPALYSALAERGYFPVEELATFRRYNSILQGHPDMNKTPGVDMSTGSLGNGLAVGVGMSLSAKLHKQDYRVYVLMGDGEQQEGLVWEAAMAAAHHRLDNLTAIIDCNGIQINGWVNDIMRIEPLDQKWSAFGWAYLDIDGHDMKQILNAFHRARINCRPTVIFAHTYKGKGVSYMEDNAIWHGKAPDSGEARLALEEIRGGYDK